ncbi:carcinoembryonic antigen-related cell adhesion molecule 1-like [Xenopus laevis]|uniref:Carcinoembryonic antigen-related cell adhesion molecule 1-like n=1 Tax=Xenopus laevis TaxID=8355 RepID=A0A8J1LDA2_XENLA|nr:carcinoembryonic antigen-related cell adhesion molecule 1-like [Xenopus laevis]
MFTYLDVPPHYVITWTTGSTTLASLEDGKSPTYGSICATRCELFQNATLRLDSLMSNDPKSYMQSIKNKANDLTTSIPVTLHVHNPLNPPLLTANPTTRPVQGNNLTLQCNAGSQTVYSYTFLRDGQSVSCSASHITCNNTSQLLDFHPITENDNGNYTCIINNPVSSRSSSSVVLDVAVKVSNVTLQNNASKPVTVDKDSVALQCSSLGTEVNYTWTLRELDLPLNPRYRLINNNSTLIISPVSREDRGYFTCTVANYLNKETSPILTLSWAPDGQITCGAVRLDDSIQLFCSWPGGYPAADLSLTFAYMEESGTDKVTENVSLTPPANVLNCEGRQGWTQYCSLIIDTPKSSGLTSDTVIEGDWGKKAILFVPLTYEIRKENIIVPQQMLPATFTWYRLTPEPVPLLLGENFTVISNDSVSYLVVTSVTSDVTGKYMCTAENLIGKTSFNFTLRLSEGQGSSGIFLSPGAVAGIVIGAIAAGSIINLIIVLLQKKLTSDKRQQAEYITPIKEFPQSGVQNPYMNGPRIATTVQQPVNSPGVAQEEPYTTLECMDNNEYDMIKPSLSFRNVAL